MNIVSILSGITLVASLTLAVEGLNWATDGEVYVASLYRLAQSEPPPPPPSGGGGSGFQPPPPPPGGTSGSFQPSGGFPPPPGGTPGQQPGGAGAFGPPPSGGGFPPPPGAIPGQAPGGTSGSFGPPPGGQHTPQFGPPPGGQPQSFPGGGATQGQFPSKGRESFPGSESSGESGEFPAELEMEEERPFVNPQEIQNAKRNIRDLFKRITSIEKLVKKSGDSGNLSRLQEIKAELNGISQGLNASDDETKSDALQTFYDSNFHEDVQRIDSAARLPQEINQILISIKRAEKAAATKAVAKLLNVDRLKGELAQMRQKAEQVRQLISTDIEEAQAEIQEFHQDTNPGMIERAVYTVVSLSQMVRQARNADLKAQLKRFLDEAVGIINSGDDYESVHEIMRSAEQLMQQSYQSRSGRR